MQIRHTDRRGSERTAGLFETIAALARDEIADFPALRAHQRQPWHAFLAQVAALALLRAGETELPDEAEAWQGLLLALTPDHPGGEAWQLIVDDWTKPALLQPPGMEAAFRRSGKQAATPDELDMLLTARNHDIKGFRIRASYDDDWLFALVSLQTQEGQMGAGNYGISRMNGGYGARVAVGLRPAGYSPGAALRRDVGRLLAVRDEIEERSEARGSIGLVWLEVWDGAGQIAFAQLDPLYVEVCRRVRLIGADRVEGAVLANSKAARISQTLRGVTNDPWAATLSDGTKSWGVSVSGFGYRQTATLLDPEEVNLPELAKLVASDGTNGLILHAVAVTRGQGKTEGFHERSILIPPKVASLFARAGGRDRVAEVTNARIRRFERQLDATIDARFFDESFWDQVAFEGPPETALARFAPGWSKMLRDEAARVLDEAVEAAPRTQMRRLRAVARARSIFDGRMRAFLDPEKASRPKRGNHRTGDTAG